jgi:hypothetical protein
LHLWFQIKMELFAKTKVNFVAANVTSSRNDVNCSSSAAEEEPAIYRVSLDLMFYGLSLIVPAGLICNGLSLAVFMSRVMRHRASSWYLAALAVSDTLALLAVTFDYWVKNHRIGLTVRLDFFTQIHS